MEKQIKKYFHDELTPSEKLEFLRKVESDDELQKQFIECKNMYALLSVSHIVDNGQESRKAYIRFHQVVRKRKIRRIMLKTAGYAAMVALLIICTHMITIRYFSKPLISDTTNTLFVPAGQRVNLTLHDGTNVWLNAQTKLTYPSVFNGNERRVTIEGEGYFDVAKDAGKPFIVNSQGVEMRVLGTKFNVYSYPSEGYVQASLIEGALHVYLSEGKSEGVLLKPDEQVTIIGDQMRQSNSNGEDRAGNDAEKLNSATEMCVGKITHRDYFLWKDGIYSFENELLINILKKLQLYYDVQIIVNDPSIFQWEYTGKFRQRDGIDEILRMIQHIHKFKIEKDEEKNIITLSKQHV